MVTVNMPREAWDVLLSLQYFGSMETILDPILEEIKVQVDGQEY